MSSKWFHVQFLAGAVDQSQVDGDARLWGDPRRRIGDEFGVGERLPELPLRFRWPIGVEDLGKRRPKGFARRTAFLRCSAALSSRWQSARR